LKVFKITLPPLRKHNGDIPLLVDYFIEVFNNQFRKKIRSISKEAEKFLREYDWPGNVRELRNVIERAIILETRQDIHSESIPAEIRSGVGFGSNKSHSSQFEIPETGFSLSEFEKMLLKQALSRTNYNQSHAARILGITRDSLRYRKKKYRL
jgi:transcriptional regulator with PAS, ATPase and Fis domain